MAAVIDQKIFDYSEDALLDIADFIGPYLDEGGPIRIKIAVQKSDEQRQYKTTARETLKRLVRAQEAYYRKHGYDFDFYLGAYYWNDRAVHITQGEALFLFRWLVLNEYDRDRWYYLRNMRRRFGAAFLKEIPEE